MERNVYMQTVVSVS